MGNVSFRTAPDRYRHWSLRVEDQLAYLVLDVDERGGLDEGYELKLNSYDLGVDIELYDAVQRLRFEHPQVRAVVLTSGKDKVFCAGANIRMLATASHQQKVNFCKFTNETRNGIEDAQAGSGLPFLAAVNGSAAGGGYELALACDWIALVDDNSSTVALPELPLLGVLPGTGGLTRLVDKRKVRRDLADVFATRAEGVRGRTAVQWRLVDQVVPPRQFEAAVREQALTAAENATRLAAPAPGGVALSELGDYRNLAVEIDRETGAATITVRGPDAPAPQNADQLRESGGDGWFLRTLRELDDAILDLRTNEPEIGTWLLRTVGDAAAVLAHERVVLDNAGTDWLATEILLYAKRTLKRLDVTSRSLIALIEPGSCFAGWLLDLALACDRQYLLDEPEAPNAITLSAANFGPLPMGNGLTRLANRFHDVPTHDLTTQIGRPLEAKAAVELGLVTAAPDDLDWDDEIRIVLEERAAFSPDALTGMEANIRFAGPETTETKVFGRLSAWQNWIFTRPNAVGERGALVRYGTGQRAEFDRKRV
jgi:benzoyl-CoA-dihydrodiol lyase